MHPNGSPRHLAQLVTRLYDGPQVNVDGIRWLSNSNHTECLISVELLAQRAFPLDFSKVKGRLSPFLRERREKAIKYVHDNMRTTKRLLLDEGFMAELTNEKGFFVKDIVTDTQEAKQYSSGKTYGIVLTENPNGARFSARQDVQEAKLTGGKTKLGDDFKVLARHGHLDTTRQVEAALRLQKIAAATDQLAQAVLDAPAVRELPMVNNPQLTR